MGSTIYTKPQQYAIISILILIMEADGVIDPNEVKFLNEIFAELNITESDLEIISSCDFNQSCSILNGMGKEKIENATALFLEMAKCDGYADSRELEIINKLVK